MTLYQGLTLILTGFAAGLLGGMLGIGGSIIMIPAMVIVAGKGQHISQAAAMIVNICVAVPAAIRHFRAGAVIPKSLQTMIPAAVAAVIVGVQVSDLSAFHGEQEILLTGLFGAFLIYVFYRNLIIVLRPTLTQQLESAHLEPARLRWGGLAVGLMGGFAGGLLGIGGGIVTVPAQQVLMHMPIRNAVANSAVTMICLSTIGAAYKNYHLVTDDHVPLSEPLTMAALLIPGAIIGSYLGAGLTHSVATRYVRSALLVVLLLAALSMIAQCIGPLMESA